jgi:hypothetical protein
MTQKTLSSVGGRVRGRVQTVDLDITIPTFTIDSPSSLPTFVQGTAITPIQFTVANAPTGTKVWGSSGLPAGLSFSSTTGVLSGTPSATNAGVQVTFTCTVGTNPPASVVFTAVIVAAAGTFTIDAPTSIADLTKNQNMTAVFFTAINRTDPTTWTIAASSPDPLPNGLTFANGAAGHINDGKLSGKPTAAGTSTVRFKATDSASHVDTIDLTFKVVNPATVAAPDYSAYVTRESIGAAGGNAGAFMVDQPNVAIVRLDIQANTVINYSAGTTTYNWGGTDSAVKTILDAGCEVLALITYNSRDYSGYSDDKFVPTKNGVAHNDANGHTFDQWVTWYSNSFAKAVMNRYNSSGTAKPTTGVLANKITATYCVRFVELWNESNNVQFWDPNGSGNFILCGNMMADYDYAELMAACYDAIKSISPNIYVANGGFAARGDGYHANGVRPFTYFQNVIDHWTGTVVAGHMAYTKTTNGWDDVPLDFICHHAYGPTGRPGASQTFGTAFPPTFDNPSNKLFVDTVKVHNVAYQAGFGSLKVWSTESDDNWDPICVTGYGFRGNPPSTSYVQINTPFPKYDRSMKSAQEEYDSVRTQYRYWTGADAWPAASAFTYFPQWDILGRDPVITDDLPLGPKFHFSCGRDFKGYPYQIPYIYEEHFGLYYHLNSGLGKKTVTGTNNDPWDALAQFPRKP